MLEAIANPDARQNIDVEPDIAGELIKAAQIPGGELVVGYEGGTPTAGQRDRGLAAPERQDRTAAEDSGAAAGVAEPARRGI
jgi:hypothetical protein